ncbi:P-loop containing nucleoside triphosphate hydrolase protein [Ascodesmis nigricans]|uniref:P-loop containing nucleoside triphosphate hydrolase protein n=1 Tax=Ascodesmis nigricans TaxID=341454 RepID=A0A4V3SIX2_9PEZI|nr:P-loop containing nucleoside triphosphate hydrolase protein [Ascodesmis nigricans]
MSADTLRWYSMLFPYRVDLIGDYAGTEHFLIDGDSLIHHVLSDPRIDFSTGFQLLHAVYAVESFLADLTRRKCFFHVVFFEEHRHLAISGRAKAKEVEKWRFAREAVKNHLLHTVNEAVEETGEETLVYTFDGLGDERFARFLEVKRPYFVMAHDGDDVDDDVEGAACAEHVEAKKAIRRFMEMGYNVALINQIEFIDSKVFTQILETHSIPGDAVIDPPIIEQTTLSTPLPSLPENLDSNRARITIAAIARVLAEDSDSASLAATYLLHTSLLEQFPLSQRGSRFSAAELQKCNDTANVDAFLGKVLTHATELLSNGEILDDDLEDDLHDFVDGRLLLSVMMKEIDYPEEAKTRFGQLVDVLNKISSSSLSVDQLKTGVVPDAQEETVKDSVDKDSVLAFDNEVFNPYLERLKIDEQLEIEDTTDESVSQRYHWHNANKPLIATRRLPPKPPPPQPSGKGNMRMIDRNTRRRMGRLRKKDQQFYSQMSRYAQSLTGGALNPEKVIADPTGTNQKKKLEKELKEAKGKKEVKGGKNAKPEKPTKGGKPEKPVKGGKPEKPGKGAPKLSKAEQIKLKNAEAKAGKGAEALQKLWTSVWRELEKFKDDEAIITRLDDFIKKVQKAIPTNAPAGASVHEGVFVETEVRLYKVMVLQNIYNRYCTEGRKSDGLPTVAQIFEESRKILPSLGLTKPIHVIIKNVFKCLKIELPNVPVPATVPDKRLSFMTKWTGKMDGDLGIGMSSEEFQLEYFGPFMDRNMDSAPDDRVPFEPDGWQRKVLDELDSENSVFVVAPTSAGKTFISFHAMKKVLRSDDNGVLVYVAPTKALVNQIAAEVISRFSKDYRYANAGKTVWAIHTGDYHMNKPEECQILITVPQILSTMLLSPVNAKRWTPRLKRIIYDEIHSIGNSEDGAIWEQLLLLSPCPIVALSATVGNPGELSQWLAATQSKINTKLTMVQHPYRYSDLRKFTFNPDAAETYKSFKGLGRLRKFGAVDQDSRMATVHPVAAITNPNNGLPDDLSLEPRDCLTLYRAMVAVSTPEFPVPTDLDYKKAFGTTGMVIKKADVIVWEADLKSQLRKWMKDPRSPFMDVVRKVGGGRPLAEERRLVGLVHAEKLADPEIVKIIDPENKDTEKIETDGEEAYIDLDVSRTAYLREKTLPLLQSLHTANALPAILFSYDRLLCEYLCKHLVNQLKEAETKWRASDPKWKALMKQYEDYLIKKKKAGKYKAPKLTSQDGDKLSKAELAREAAETEGSTLLESFDPEDPSAEFSFADFKKHPKSELDLDLQTSDRWHTDPIFIQGLRRGIGVHHSGLNRRYRQAVEMLFRKGYLRVVISTETLALGINMPCKTVVFAGDNVHLTALNYRQASGRAGRRGFDLLGNVIFHGVTQEKVHRLISSRLPSLMGHFPITTGLVLRLCILLNNSEQAEFSKQAIGGLLSQNRLVIGEEAVPEQVLHHLRFSIDFLRRQKLINGNGGPMNFATFTSHLYYIESAAFSFHTLLSSGYLGEICADVNKPGAQAQVIEDLMLVFANIFGRKPCSKRSGIKLLPPLPEKARKILEEQNKTTLDLYSTYARTFSSRFCKDEVDNVLPFSKVQCGRNSASSAPLPKARSQFFALSGHTDKFESIPDLASSIRKSVFLDGSSIPYTPVNLDETLNSYLLEFFRHGSLTRMTTDHRIRPGDRWFYLKDFSVVLGIIVTGLTVYLKDGPRAWFDPSKLSGEEEGGELTAKEDIGEDEMEEEEEIEMVETAEGEMERAKAPRELFRVLQAVKALQTEFEEKFRNVNA